MQGALAHKRFVTTRIVVSVLLALFFFVSAAAKLVSLGATVSFINAYLEVNSQWWLAFFVALVSMAELLLAYYLVTRVAQGKTTRATFWTVVLLSFFTGLSLGRYVLGIGGSCGCFGALGVMSSPQGSLLRDAGALLLGGTLFALSPGREFRLYKLLLTIIPLLALGNATLSLVNEYFGYSELLSTWRTRTSPYWYGISSPRVGRLGLDELTADLFGFSAVVKPMDESGFLHEVHSSLEGNEPVGWIVTVALPFSITARASNYLEMAIAFDEDARVRKVQISGLNGKHFKTWPFSDDVARFLEAVTLEAYNGFVTLDRLSVPKSMNDYFARLIVSVVNNAIHNIPFYLSEN